VQGAHAPPSRRHSEVAPLSSTVKDTEPLPESDSAGGEDVIVVCGAAVSTVNDRTAAVASVLPAASVARTLTEWPPSDSAGVVHGLVHAPYAPLSTRHANVEPDSVEANANAGVASFVGPLGPAVIDVSGGVVSAGGLIVHVCEAGVASVLPAASVARTLNVCEPVLRPE
jgi:hypothetical protein